LEACSYWVEPPWDIMRGDRASLRANYSRKRPFEEIKILYFGVRQLADGYFRQHPQGR